MIADVKLNAKIHNRFDVYRKDASTGEEKQIAYAENIILDNLFVMLFEGYSNGYFSGIFIGRGTGTLDESRTTLFSQIAKIGASGATYSYVQEGRIWSLRKQITLTETQYVGETITEVGIGDNMGAGGIATHAMLQDMNGNTVSIEKKATDIITIYATVYVVLEQNTFDNGAITIWDPMTPSKVTSIIKWLFREEKLSNVVVSEPNAYYTACCNPISVLFSNSPTNYYPYVRSTPSASMSVALKKATITVPRLAVGSGNLADGIHGFMLALGLFIDLTKVSTWGGSFIEGEPLGIGDGTTQDYKTDYGLVRSGAIVYVDGVQDVSATVDVNKPKDNNLLRYFNFLDGDDNRVMVGLNSGYMSGDCTGLYAILENPYYATYGVDDVYIANMKLEASNDLETWVEVAPSTGGTLTSRAIDTAYRSYRYWKMIGVNTSCPRFLTATSDDLDGELANNVHLSFVPDEDAVITIDYTTSVVVKTTDYVFDFKFSIEADRYTEEN